MLGVIIGVAAVILLVAIGTGVQQEITGSIEGSAPTCSSCSPATSTGGGGGGGGWPAAAVRKRFTIDDADLVERRIRRRGDRRAGRARARDAEVRATATLRSTIAAANENGDEVFTADYVDGRHYNRSEYASAARVVMLGATPARQALPGAEPRRSRGHHQRPAVQGHRRTAEQGGTLSGDQDNQIYMPTTTAQRLLGVEEL